MAPEEDDGGAAAYATLMQTVENLQSDLQQTITTCHGLREANGQLRKNYEACKSELVKQRDKFTATRAQLVEATKAKIDADRGTEEIVHKWKSQLDERTKELDALQAKLVPQDLDMLRIQVQEELEVPHQQRVAELEAQSQAFQQMFFNVRRELERSKTEFEQYAAYQASVAAAAAEKRDGEVAALKRRLAESEARGANDDSEERARKAEMKSFESETARRELGRENESLRTELEEATASSGRSVASLKARIASLESALAAKTTDEKVARQEVRASREEAANAESLRAAVEAELSNERSAAASATSASRAKEKQLKQQASEASRERDAAMRDLEVERAEYARKEAAAERKYQALELQRDAAQRASQEAKLAADEAVERLRRESRDSVASLEERAVALELAVSERDRQLADLKAAATSDARKVAAELKVEQSRVVRLEAQINNSLQPELAKALGRVEDLESTLSQEHANADRLEDALRRERAALEQAEEARKRAADFEQAAQDAKLQVEQERKDHVAALNKLKETIKTDRIANAASVKDQTDLIRKKAQETLRKEQKRAQAYKLRALKERDRAVKAKSALSTAASFQVSSYIPSNLAAQYQSDQRHLPPSPTLA